MLSRLSKSVVAWGHHRAPLARLRWCKSSAAGAPEKRNIDPSVTSLEEARSTGAVLVDKTMETAALLKPVHQNFLARPHKTGKTLALDTAYAILSAKTDLFEGTKLMKAVDARDPSVADVAKLWSETTDGRAGVPVLRLDFGLLRADPQVLEEELRKQIVVRSQEDLDVYPSSSCALGTIEDLFWAMRRRGQRLAVLIDDYDQPIVKALTQNGGMMDERIHKILFELDEVFMALKAAFGHNGHCLLMTGVTRFTPVRPCPLTISVLYKHLTYRQGSVLDGANSIMDVSFDHSHETAFLFSWREITETYPCRLQALLGVREEDSMEDLRTTLETYFGGYSFLPSATDRESRLFHPFDIVTLLANINEVPRSGPLRGYWSDQERLGWLSQHVNTLYLRREPWSKPLDLWSTLYQVEVKHMGNNYNKQSARTSLLLQSGCLTFKEYQEGRQGPTVTLEPTNQLTQEALNGQLVDSILAEVDLNESLERMQELLAAGDLLGVWQHVAGLLQVCRSHESTTTSEPLTHKLVTVMLKKVESGGKVMMLRERAAPAYGGTDFVLFYGPRNEQGLWRHGIVVQAVFMNGNEEKSIDLTEDGKPLYLDVELAALVGGEENVRKQMQAVLEHGRGRKKDEDAKLKCETLRRAVIVWSCKAQVVAYEEYED